MAAFRRAVDKGYGIELDVHLTADNQLVVFHDDTLTRMCGMNKKNFELFIFGSDAAASSWYRGGYSAFQRCS